MTVGRAAVPSHAAKPSPNLGREKNIYETNPFVRPGAIENAVHAPRTNPIGPNISHTSPFRRNGDCQRAGPSPLHRIRGRGPACMAPTGPRRLTHLPRTVEGGVSLAWHSQSHFN